MWKLINMFLITKGQITGETRKYFEQIQNDKHTKQHTKICGNAGKAVLREEFITLNAFIVEMRKANKSTS